MKKLCALVFTIPLFSASALAEDDKFVPASLGELKSAVADVLAGEYVSVFRGSGIEFDEVRPYVSGDDVRSIDWNATARAGEPFVKRFREERDQTLFFALDVSASMRFGSLGASKARTAAHALALMAAAAGPAVMSTRSIATQSPHVACHRPVDCSMAIDTPS